LLSIAIIRFVLFCCFVFAAVNAANFIAQGVTFRNTAGPTLHQAVALRVNGDQAAFQNCLIDGYQDSLYAHSLRQFYRDTTIMGTVDFVFGNAAAVFQDCTILVRAGAPGATTSTITAQVTQLPLTHFLSRICCSYSRENAPLPNTHSTSF
jgi:pectinesterase